MNDEREQVWTEGFIAGVNAADAARNGVFDLYDKYCRNPYERPHGE